MIRNLLLLQESENLYCGILSQKVFVYNLQKQTAAIVLKCLKMKIKNVDMWNLSKSMKPHFIWSPGKKQTNSKKQPEGEVRRSNLLTMKYENISVPVPDLCPVGLH